MTHVLFVEDTLEILTNIGFNLEMDGYQMSLAENGQKAIDFLKSTTSLPDIIVSDIMMPLVNGYELLTACQQNPEWSNIPFIFLTALGARDDVMTGKKMGVDDYLVKPFLTEELIVAIENKLRRVRQIQAHAEDRLDQTRRELLTIISHELRTPLSAIYGGAELLADSLEVIPDSMSHRMLSLVQSGAKRMRRLVDQIVMMTQLDSKSLAQSLERGNYKYDMQGIIESAYKLLEEEWQPDMPDVAFNFNLPTEPVTISGNPDFLTMMVAEGIRNAVNFSPKQGQIEIELMHDDQYAYTSITDQGRGIPADDLPRIWERFVQVNRDKYEQQGMGLGLSLTRESARIHQGDTFVESVVGQGTRFILKLPLVASKT